MKITLTENGDSYWEYIDVPEGIYREFRRISRVTINAYFTAWAKRDWGISLPMVTRQDMRKLKEVISRTSKRSYPELFVFPDIAIGIDFWLSYWVASHMKVEIETYKE